MYLLDNTSGQFRINQNLRKMLNKSEFADNIDKGICGLIENRRVRYMYLLDAARGQLRINQNLLTM